uniref:Uncharacterized protein n=1 Tax=Siphoviridae sp. ctCUc43 TaxID=2825379 RepID=A0A8S5QK46_9CAUD|nr:MAG TPA: hypothetical protein [Siphoviridae sp. ctCUc43]
MRLITTCRPISRSICLNAQHKENSKWEYLLIYLPLVPVPDYPRFHTAGSMICIMKGSTRLEKHSGPLFLSPPANLYSIDLIQRLTSAYMAEAEAAETVQ